MQFVAFKYELNDQPFETAYSAIKQVRCKHRRAKIKSLPTLLLGTENDERDYAARVKLKVERPTVCREKTYNALTCLKLGPTVFGGFIHGLGLDLMLDPLLTVRL